MEMHDAYEYVAPHLKYIEATLTKFRATHGVALKEPILERLDDAITAAGVGKFEISDYPSEHIRIDDGKRVLEALQDVESELRSVVWSQSST